jgi:extracellular factor (EF) 3-hydroxypalmitic acid methyl ester biosynthesis protein
MSSGLHFLQSLSARPREWLLSHGVERSYSAGDKLIERQQGGQGLYILLSGLADVLPNLDGGKPVATLGPGELAGELTFLDNGTPTAFLVAREETRALVIEAEMLRAEMARDPELGTEIYRGIAQILSSRFRRLMGELNSTHKDRDTDAVSRLWNQLRPRIDAFQDLISEADKAAIRDGDVPAEIAAKIQQAYLDFQHFTTAIMGDASGEDEMTKETVGARLQAELLPYLLMSENGERWYAKPRGYAGDFYSIALMYEDVAKGPGRLGPTIDRCFLDMPAAVAVKNRRGLLAGEIQATLDQTPDRPIRVMSLACGPAQELFDVYEKLPDPGRLLATGIDIDLQALAFVADRRDKNRRLKKPFALENENLIYLATGRRTLDVPPQDLIYSIGLIDYFADEFVVPLMNWIHRMLRPGGRAILGNFHPRNPSKAMQDYLLDWRLIHRTDEDMDRLYQASNFGRPCSRVLYEAQRINLFAECVKAE